MDALLTRHRYILLDRSAEALIEKAVSLRAAALQWSVGDNRIVSTVVGTANPAHVVDLVDLARTELPDGLSATLQGLASPPLDWLW